MFHVGGARSALFNWALAKRQGGIFVLRIEDTDAARNKPEWTQGILDALAALGMHGDDPTFEGPYYQSDNAGQHGEAGLKLLAAGKAYYCDCTRDDVVARTGSQHLGYDGHCRDRGLDYQPGRALRFRTPDEGETAVVDLIRGNPTFPNSAMEDFVIARGDGSPVFLIANVVDDMDERITHVIRGEEHLPNAPKQQLLWEALGATPPTWAHLPVIVNEKRQKLSKRRDKVALEDYLADGILPDAMVNYLMLLGWAPGNDEEILPFDELVSRFDIADVNSASAFFDIKKLMSFNGEYIRALPVDVFEADVLAWLAGPGRVEDEETGLAPVPWADADFDAAAFHEVAPLLQTRVAAFKEVPANIDFLFLDQPVDDQASWVKAMKEPAAELLADVRQAFAVVGAEGQQEWDADTLKQIVLEVGERYGLKLGKSQAPVRVATTGRTIGLPLFESLVVLGRDKTLARIDRALTKFDI
jgi:glutamyl-tRNA synthetase